MLRVHKSVQLVDGGGRFKPLSVSGCLLTYGSQGSALAFNLINMEGCRKSLTHLGSILSVLIYMIAVIILYTEWAWYEVICSKT